MFVKQNAFINVLAAAQVWGIAPAAAYIDLYAGLRMFAGRRVCHEFPCSCQEFTLLGGVDDK